jgi:UDP-N-acetylglucosamine 1-carboxyvinyltransferase
MYKYIVEGGFPIKGRIKASGNKNAALPCITACLLSDQAITLQNIPDIEDVHVLFEILKHLGSTVTAGVDRGEWIIHTPTIVTTEVPQALAKKIRASILLAGPMLGRAGKLVLPPPGGDVIGRRRLDTHFLALESLGARVEVNSAFRLNTNKLVGTNIFLDEASVTGTENAIMAAVLAEGTTVIENAASEPHVQDVCLMLNAMGAKISGIGSNILTIHGVPSLGGATFRISPDFMEIGSLIGLAAVTGGDLIIEDVVPAHLKMTKLGFAKLGIHWETSGSTLHIKPGQTMKVQPDMGGQIPKIDDSIWPGFPADLLSIMLTVATQVEGTVLIHEKMYESRMFFVDKLISMGARIVLCDPHRAVISGPARLNGSTLVSPDVRAGMALVIAALCAEGTSEIHNVYQIERGYENLAERLQSLGAQIKRVPVQ